jgi:methyl-accepting chemotaxis protein
LLKADKTVAAIDMVEQIATEETKLNHELEALIDEIIKFTAHAAHQAEQHEKFAIKLIIIATIASIVWAELFAWLLITRSITRPLRSLISSVTALRLGDLDIDAAITRLGTYRMRWSVSAKT